MTAPETQPGKSPLAERLGQARVDLRQDLEVSRHVVREGAEYVLRDPMTFASFRLSRDDYVILTRVDRRAPLADIFESLVADGELAERDEDMFYEFVVSLHRLGFLDLPIPDESMLYDRHVARGKAERFQRLMSVFFMQVPLWNPDRFLERTGEIARALFSRPAFIIWCVLQVVAIWIAILNLDELTAPLNQILVMQNAPALWGTLIGLKLVHEFGHAWACKRFGGHVPEMGAYLIVFTPCAYVDATAAWGFSRKIERIIVSFAGMYFELAVAAVAMIVWSMSDSAAVKSICYNIIFLASVATIAFNANPMMKSDGYFALSDALEVPNLRQRATAYATGLLKRIAFGVPQKRDPAPRSIKAAFVLFGALLPFYRASIVIGISAGIAAKLFVVGIVLAVLYIGMELVKLMRSLFSLFFLSPETGPVRFRAATIGAVCCLAVPLCLVGVPMPGGVAARGIVHAIDERPVRAELDGILVEMHAEPGDHVDAGTIVATIDHPQIEDRLARARAEVAELRINLRAAEIDDPGAARQAAHRLAASLERLRELEGKLARRKIRAPMSGIVSWGEERPLVGRWYQRGSNLMRIDGEPVRVVVLLTEDEFTRIRPEIDDSVTIRGSVASRNDIAGVVERVIRKGRHEIDEEGLTQIGGGEIAVDAAARRSTAPYFEVHCRPIDTTHELRPGASGRVLFEGDRETLGRRAVRALVNFANRLRHGTS